MGDTVCKTIMRFELVLLALAVGSCSSAPLCDGDGDCAGALDAEDGADFLDEAAAGPCCQGACPAGTIKVYSVDKIFNQCGEGCIPEGKFWLYHLFEAGLKKATIEHPCAAEPARYKVEGNYSIYVKT